MYVVLILSPNVPFYVFSIRAVLCYMRLRFCAHHNHFAGFALHSVTSFASPAVGKAVFFLQTVTNEDFCIST